MSKRKKLIDYNKEPVIYCSQCYSLGIIHEEAIGEDCCKECGCSDFKTTQIDSWIKLYEQRYGHKYIETNHDIRKSPIFMMSVEKLQIKVYEDSSWKDICKTMYPAFPDGLSKADSVILLFAKLMQDSRLDELKIELINRS